MSRKVWRRGLVGAAAMIAAAVASAGSAAAGTSAADAAPIHAAQVVPAKGTRILSEEFGGTNLDGSRWSPCYWWSVSGCTNLSNHELEWYEPQQVKISGGLLQLEAKKQTVTGINGQQFKYVSGLISGASPTSNLFSFTYGYVEARVRIPKGRGLWSAFWMLPTTRSSLPEVDIFEAVGERPTEAQLHLHTRIQADGTSHNRGFTWRGPDLSAGWHTYGVEWKPNSLTWFIDGVRRWRVTAVNQIPHEPMYLLANLAVGGTLTQAPGAATKLPASLRVDYVRVWALP